MSISHIGRPVVVLVVGVWLYQVAVMAGGYFAAIAIPRSYFDFFGREYGALANALLQLVSFAVPVAVLVAGGALAAAHLLGVRRSFFPIVLLGMVLCCVFWVAVTVLFVQSIGGDAASFLARLLLPSWSEWPAYVAPWAGLAFAWWASRRSLSRDA